MNRVVEILRLWIFWIIDFLKGGAVAKHYKEVRLFMDNRLSSIPNEKQEQHLQRLLEHATESCAYYNDLKGNNELNAFPVVDKSIIKNNGELFISRGTNLKDTFSVTTSGSTGTPFRTYQDKIKKRRNTADTIYFAGMAGYKLGHHLVYLKIWVESKMRKKLEYWIQNVLPVDVLHLNDKQIDSLIREMENGNSTIGILGYASALELICKYLDKWKYPVVNANVKSIIAISETLNNYTRNSMERYFGVPVVSRYSNLENGIIAQEELNHVGMFLINTASYHVEVLKLDSDEPAEYGELGRIVITDLFNYAMPMIRYDTGDLGALEVPSPGDSRRYFSTVEGRRLDQIYNTNGDLISSYVVYKNMWQYHEIDQYQLIQERARQYTFKINTTQQFTKEEQLVNEFKSYLGQDADIRIKYVSEIPLLASGKRKKIVNNCPKKT